MRRALVTGATGFLGSHVVEALLRRGVAVRAAAPPGEPRLPFSGEVTWVDLDVRDPAACRRATEGVDVAFHLAALYEGVVRDPARTYDVNVRGTMHLLHAAREQGVGTVVLTASMVALGRPAPGTVGDEEVAYDAWHLDFHYSRSKYLSRLLAEDMSHWGLDVRVVCPTIVLGPGDRRPTPSGRLLLGMARGAPPLVTPGGGNYVDVRDAAEVHVLAAERGRPGRRYLAAGTNLDHAGLLAAVDRVVGRRRRIRTVPVAVGRALVAAQERLALLRGAEPDTPLVFFEYGLQPSYFSSARAREELGATFRPLERTLVDALTWFRSHGLYEGPLAGNADRPNGGHAPFQEGPTRNQAAQS